MKKIKFLSILFSSIFSISTIASVGVLSSCTTTSSSTHSYNNETKTIELTSNNINNENIFYVYSDLINNTNNYINNLVLIINQWYEFNLINTQLDLSNITIQNWNINIPVNNDNIKQITIINYNINFENLNIPNSNQFIISNKNIAFNGLSINDIPSLDWHEILNNILMYSNLPIPSNCYINTSFYILKKDEIMFYIFLPSLSTPFGKLTIQNRKIEFNDVIPNKNIASTNITNNNLEELMDWNVTSINSTNFNYIDSILDTKYNPINSFYSSYYICIFLFISFSFS